MDDDSPDDVAHRAFSAQLFADHPLGRETAGDRQTVQRITPADVRRFFESHYHADSMVISLAGPIDHDEALKLVSTAFADLRPTGQVPERVAPASMGNDHWIDDDTEQVHIVMGGRSLARGDDDREALDVVNHVFGGGLSSRLFEEIRERRGLAYSVYSGVSAYADSGAFQMYAGTQPGRCDDVVELMRSELDRLVKHGISDDELDVATGYLTGAFELGLEDTAARMARNGAQLITTGTVREIEYQVARWAAVDQTAARRVVDRVLTSEPIVVTVGPSADGRSARLRSRACRRSRSESSVQVGGWARRCCAAVAVDTDLDLVAAVDPSSAGKSCHGRDDRRRAAGAGRRRM